MAIQLFEHGVTIEGDRSSPRRRVGWRDDAVVFTRMRFACDSAVYEGCCSHHLLVLTLSGRTGETVSASGAARYRGRDRPGALSFTPAGVERRAWWRDADITFVGLWVLPELAAALGVPRLGGPATVNGNDPTLAHLLRWMSDEVTADAAPDALFAEQVAALALRRVGAATPTPTRRGTLPARLVRAVEAYVAKHLADGVAVSDLAALADMPIDTFARHFRDTVGMTPHAFVIERRIDRAEALLLSGEAIATVACRCGFSSQSHLTTAFRTRRGTTPARWRANFRPET